MVIVNQIIHWYRDKIPEKWRGKEYDYASDDGPIVVTAEEFLILSQQYDVAIMHHCVFIPTRKERKQGKSDEYKTILWLDTYGGKFRQR